MRVKKQPVFYVASAVFFIAYLYVLRVVWHRWVPYNAWTDLLSLAVMVAVLIPAAAVSAGMLLKFIKFIKNFMRFTGRRIRG